MKKRVRGEYAPRNITIMPEWLDSFEQFYADVGEPPTETSQIDRIDNNLGYWPTNVRWVEAKQNANNRSDNIVISMLGETRTLQEWCDYLGIDRVTVTSRWRTLFSPAKRKNRQIVQLSMQDQVVAEFDSIKSAEAVSGVNRSSIQKCLSGGNKSSGGFKWRYKT